MSTSTKKEKQKILFICTHNSARSQMAEGLLNALHGDKYQAFSAGTIATRVNPHAIAVMKEIGIDISHHQSKTIDQFRDDWFDVVVTVCDHAKETCPFFPRARKMIHAGFPDPSGTQGPEEKVLQAFRQVRDEIKAWIEKEFGKSPIKTSIPLKRTENRD